MKKKLLLIMGLSVLLLTAGCAKKDIASELDANTNTEAETETDTTDGIADTAAGTEDAAAPVKEAYKVSDYITLGQYKGVEVTVEKLEVTEEDIDAAIESELSANSTEEEVTGRAVQSGDIVNIDFEGLKDGVAFEGGTSTGYDLTIGSGTFIPGFEDRIIGANVGDNIEVNVTFPEDYQQEDLAGQPVLFKVKVNAIKTTVIPELNDEYVQANTDFDSVAAYRESNRAQLQDSNEQEMKNNKMMAVLEAIISNATISSYPQTLLDYYEYEMKNYYTQQAAMYGMEFADFVAAIGLTEETFAAETKTFAEERAQQELVLSAIIEAEGMELTDAEYEAGVADIVAEYGYGSADELLQIATEAQIRESLLWEKAFNFITDQAIEK